MKRTLSAFAASCGGRLIGGDRAYTGVSTDTRTLAPGELFIALQGPRFDGAAFIAAAHTARAAGAVVSTQEKTPLAQILVTDTQNALTAAAMSWRAAFDGPLVGVAGSNGKTTVKEMIAAILAEAGATLATRGNLNNHIGVPVTLLGIDATHRFAVIEMGANHPGEMAALVRIARPTIGLITNAGAEHLEGFGSLEGVARAEGETVEGLAPDSTAIINADDAFAELWRGLTRARVVTFGVEHRADFSAERLRTDFGVSGFATRFELICPAGRTPIELKLAGRHNVVNALGAAAAAVTAGAKLEHVARGLASMRAVKGRLQFKVSKSGAWIIDDSYNANPSSMRAGIDVLAELAGRRWLAMGDMAELGDYAERSHVEIGDYARERGVERLFATGKLAALAVESFGPGAEWYPDTESLAQALDASVSSDVRLLVKGSRMNRLERVVDALAAVSSGRAAG
jgi:UDP-N-acetylmuramoyl-tripeptide--D-alanyl-D-alanine ligase